MDRRSGSGSMEARSLFPAHAGMDRGLGSLPREPHHCSPHTRGWTDAEPVLISAAPAVPRTRGDGPYETYLIDQVIVPVPRTRGDGPGSGACRQQRMDHCSPHTRGWTVTLPASTTLTNACSPHTRGWTCAILSMWTGSPTCSPHTRGWTGEQSMTSTPQADTSINTLDLDVRLGRLEAGQEALKASLDEVRSDLKFLLRFAWGATAVVTLLVVVVPVALTLAKP